MEFPRRTDLIMRVTDSCNQDCSYCYAQPHRNELASMDSQTLKNATEKFASSHDRVNFIWHGGEPLIAGISFYEEAMALQRIHSSGCSFTNSIQTNMTLADDEIIEFLVRQGFNFGTSLDGPEDLHNLTRPLGSGRGSFQRVMGGVRLLRAQGRDLGAIAVLSRPSLKRIKDIYEFFKDERINFSLNPLMRHRRDGRFDIGISADEYAAATIEMFNLYFYDLAPVVKCGTIDDFIGGVLTGKPRGCEKMGSCIGFYLAVNPDGNVYPCGRFSGENEFRLGNVNVNSVEEIKHSLVYQMMQSRSYENIPGCAQCDIRSLCNGGCAFSAWGQTGDYMGKDYFCESYRKIYLYIARAVRDELENAKNARISK